MDSPVVDLHRVEPDEVTDDDRIVGWAFVALIVTLFLIGAIPFMLW